MAALALAALALGAASWAWGVLGWPGRALVRGHLGDVAATALVYALVALAGVGRRWCAATALAVAGAIELGQVVAGGHAGPARALVLGAHFDPYDLIAYATGVALAAGWDGRGGGRGARRA